MKLFEVLKQKHSETTEGESADRLTSIMKETEDMKRQVEDKRKKIQGATTFLVLTVSALTPSIIHATTHTNTQWCGIGIRRVGHLCYKGSFEQREDMIDKQDWFQNVKE